MNTLPYDPICERVPANINYAGFKTLYQTDDEYVMAEEGTYDPDSGFFLCDDCYIRMGQPSAPNGWKATKENLLLLYRRASRRAASDRLVNPRRYRV